MNIQIQILKNTFNNYDDKSSFSNYDTIAKKYHKLYTTITKEKKGDMNNNEISLWTLINDPSPICKEKLKDEIKKWFFSLPINARIKVATIENEWLCKIIFQLYHFTQINSHSVFKPKEEYFNSEHKPRDQSANNNKKKSSIGENEDLTEDGIIYPPNKPLNTIKIIKEKKNKETQTVIYNQESLDDLSNSDLVNMNCGNFFRFKSMKEEENSIKWPYQILKKVKFFSAHHSNNFPDCVTLSPSIIMKEDMFENSFKMCCQNHQYFQSLIQPFYSTKTKNYSYMLPEWINCDEYYSIFQLLFAFFEQAILIKFILNYSFSKKGKHQPLTTSLINEVNLDRFFQDRENVINYINVYFPIETKPDLLNKTIKIEEIYTEIQNDKTKMQYMKIWKTASQKQDNYISFTKSIQNCSFVKELTASEMVTFILELYEKHGNIDFIDKLVYHNITSLWNMTMFVKEKIFAMLIKLNVERNCQELIIEESYHSSNKKHNKKKTKHASNEDTKMSSSAISNNNNSKKNQKDSKEDNDLYSHYSLSQSKQTFTNEESNHSHSTIMSNSLKHKMNNDNQNIIRKEGHDDQSGRFDDFFNEIEASDKQNDSITNSFKNDIIKNEFSHFINNNSNKQTGVLATGNLFSNSSNNNDMVDEVASHQNNNTITSTKGNNQQSQQELHHSLQLQKKEEEIKQKEVIEELDLINKKQSQIDPKESCQEDHLQCTNMNNSLTLASPSASSIKEDSTTVSQDMISSITYSNNNQNGNLSHSNPKKEKKQGFYLFDTSKKKKGKKEKHPFISKDFPLFPNAKKQGAPKSFFEKLHNDILLYDSSVSEILALTINLKHHCINHLEESISNSLKDTTIQYEKDVYGSFATGLMIEVSDVDIRVRFKTVITREEFEKVFNILVIHFTNEKKYETITPIPTASVPVIKLLFNPENFIENNNNKLLEEWKEFKASTQYKTFKFDHEEINKIKIDITFLKKHSEYDQYQLPQNDQIPTISSVSYAQNKILQYPEVKLLIRVLKRFFYIKKMNNSFNGGLSSFNLFLIILSYAQFKRGQNNQARINLGLLLYDFLDFFGKFFDFRNHYIDVTCREPYIYISSLERNDYPKTSLVILDPLTKFNASKSSYRIDDIQATFFNAFIQFKNMKNGYEQPSTSFITTNSSSSNSNSSSENFIYSLFGV